MNQASVTADGALVARGCQVKGFYITGDGTNAGRAIFYDNSSAAGTVLMELRCAKDETRGVMLPKGEAISAHVGVYVDITTVGRAGVLYD